MPAHDSENTQGPIVLVVDDTPANLSLLLNELAARGYQLRVAEDGESALEEMDYEEPDIVLLDVVMPGMDGFEVCRKIKGKPQWRTLPILFMTALDEGDEKVRAFRSGAVDYITKPIHVPEVLSRVGAHLEIRQLQASIARRNAELEEEIAMRHEAENLLCDSLNQAIFILEPPQQIVFATRLAQSLLRLYLDQNDDLSLSHDLARQLDCNDSFEIKGPDSTLRIMALSTPSNSTKARVFLMEESGAPQKPASLMSLGLTARQAEVLFWIAQGKSNPDIALILNASVRTIHKHVEHILEKLGVESRQAAAIQALSVLQA